MAPRVRMLIAEHAPNANVITLTSRRRAARFIDSQAQPTAITL